MSRGASLIDTLVGVSLMLLVFVGVAGAFQLSIELVSNNKARIGASALAQEQLEYIRSLTYDNIGVSGGIPAGTIPQTEMVALNGVSYTRRVLIRYMDDPKDGLAAADTNGITADSKEVKVSVAWNSSNGERTISLVTRASPPGVEQTVPGGTLSVSVQNAAFEPVVSAQVRIQNLNTNPAIDVTSATDLSGNTSFIGAPAASGYRITVTKSGYSNAQTYTADAQNPNPNPGHLTVSNNQTTSSTFNIDLLAQKTVRTYKAIELLTWEDLLNDATKVATTTNTEVVSGIVQLAGSEPYPANGEVQSVYLGPSYLYRWKEISWTDTEPAQTEIRYQVYYQAGADPGPVPDAVLAGNSAGFTTSPVDISSIPTTTYSTIRLRAALTTSDTAQTPSIQSWRISYENGPEPLGNIQFSMRGNKTIGADGGGVPIYKYNQSSTSDVSGAITLSLMEEDTYTITVDGAGIGYDIAESCPTQPRTLAPASNMTTLLYFAPHTAHSLLVDVRTAGGAMVPDASVRLYRLPAYDTTTATGGCGQAFFSGLSSGTPGTDPYTITVSAAGYEAQTVTDVGVSGASRASIIVNAL